jgi:hypothetical protein
MHRLTSSLLSTKCRVPEVTARFPVCRAAVDARLLIHLDLIYLDHFLDHLDLDNRIS